MMSRQTARVSARCVLVTAFQPFGGSAENASDQVAQRLVRNWHSRDLVLIARTMSIEFAAGLAQLHAAVSELQPIAILSVGEDDTIDGCTIELVGRNVIGIAPPVDGTGHVVAIDDGPPLRRCAADVAAVQVAMRAAGAATELSDDAGNGMCNVFAYVLPTLGVPSCFVHVPAVRTTDHGAAECLDVLAEALTEAIRVLSRPV